MKYRKHLYLDTAIRRGRYRKDGEAGGGVTPAGGADNAAQAGGNPGGDGTPASDSNNNGQTFDPASFWDGPGSDTNASPSGESAAQGNPAPAPQSQQQQQPTGVAQQVQERLNSIQFEPIFDATMAEEINQGNYEGINKRIQAQFQQAIREALSMNVSILKPFGQQLVDMVRGEMNSTLTNKDNQKSLVEHFPAAKNPTMARMIQPIFDQALKNTGGNAELAVTQTKEMLKFMADESAGDLGLEVAPRGNGDHSYRPPVNVNWLDELTSR